MLIDANHLRRNDTVYLPHVGTCSVHDTRPNDPHYLIVRTPNGALLKTDARLIEYLETH